MSEVVASAGLGARSRRWRLGGLRVAALSQVWFAVICVACAETSYVGKQDLGQEPTIRLTSSLSPGVQLSVQSALVDAASRNPRQRGAGLLAIARLDPPATGEPKVDYFVTGTLEYRDSARVNASTPFGLASATKAMVATLAMALAERGQLDLDKPVLDWLSDPSWLLDHAQNRRFLTNLRQVTVAQLLAHRSGFADYWDDRAFLNAWYRSRSKYWPQGEILSWAGDMSPVCAPGDCFNYSDTNYVILGRVLEELAGEKLHSLLRREILEPAAMTCTWMFFEEAPPPGCETAAHAYEGALDVTANRMQSADWSGGGLYSTLDDQLRFLRALFGGDLVSDASLQRMTSWRRSDLGSGVDYGLGLLKDRGRRGMILIGHTGIHNSFSFFWPEGGLLFVGSLNQQNNNAVSNLLYPVIRILRRDGATAQ